MNNSTSHFGHTGIIVTLGTYDVQLYSAVKVEMVAFAGYSAHHENDGRMTYV